MSTPVVGNYVCINPACPLGGYSTTNTTCEKCLRPTRDRTEPELVIPNPRPPSAPLAQTIKKGGDVGSRVIFGGFWAVMAAVFALGSIVLLGQGEARGIFGFVLAILAGLYARYIFRGGRWRFVLW